MRILASIAFTSLLTLATLAQDQSRRPNVVFIMADDMGFECLGANGSKSYRTPQLDALAKGGLRLTSAHSQPVCTPTRVQVMTGLYNHRNYRAFGWLDPEAETFGKPLACFLVCRCSGVYPGGSAR